MIKWHGKTNFYPLFMYSLKSNDERERKRGEEGNSKKEGKREKTQKEGGKWRDTQRKRLGEGRILD